MKTRLRYIKLILTFFNVSFKRIEINFEIMFIFDISFYSTDGMNWLLLPKATKCGRFLSPLAINKFEGDPSIVTNVYDVNPPFPPNEDPKIYYDVIAYSDFSCKLFLKKANLRSSKSVMRIELFFILMYLKSILCL